MPKPSDPDQYSEKETKLRMDDALRRALNTPPKTHADMKAKPKASPKPAKGRRTGPKGGVS